MISITELSWLALTTLQDSYLKTIIERKVFTENDNPSKLQTKKKQKIVQKKSCNFVIKIYSTRDNFPVC